MPLKMEFKVFISFIYLKITSQCEVHIEVITCIYFNSDLKIDITEPSHTNGKEGPEQKMDGHRRYVGKVIVHMPSPPIKNHHHYIGDDPFFLCPQMDGIYAQAKLPGNKNRKKR